MTWMTYGQIFDPEIHAPWVHSHAQVPTPWLMDDRVRILYAGRNTSGTSFISYVDLDRSDPTRIVYVSDEPILPLGKVGTFDDEGMMPSATVSFGTRVYCYYSGWNRRLTCPYHNATGLIVSDDGGNSFFRLFDGPVLDRISSEPYLAVTPTVMIEDALWKMWYVSGIGWEKISNRYEPVYVIKHAFSKDGVRWERPANACISPQNSLEAFSRPCVLKESGVYKMWYCFRGSHDYRGGTGSYRLGYAESVDGLHWQRMDESIECQIPRGSWDNEMQCYPYVFFVDGKRYVLYNGNGFGRSGFGLAEWIE